MEAVALFVGKHAYRYFPAPSLKLDNWNGGQIIGRLKEIASHVPMILLTDPARMASQANAADALLPKKNCSPLELLERVKNMSARKRGPRKGSTRVTHLQHELAVAS